MIETENRRIIRKMLQLPLLLRKRVSRPFARSATLPTLQVYVLETIYAYGQLNMSSLSRELDVKSQQMTRLVDVLVERGYVERMPDPTSRRVVLVRLTQAGESFLQEAYEQFDEAVDPFISGLSSDDRGAFLQAVETLYRIIGQATANV